MARHARQPGLLPDARPLLRSADRALSRLLAPAEGAPRHGPPPLPPGFDGWLRAELDRLYPELRDTPVARRIFARRFGPAGRRR